MTRSKTPEPNKYGISPPKGCTIWGVHGEALQIATPRTGSQRSVFEDSLLIEGHHLDQCITGLVRQSATLKAWFAYRISLRTVQTASSPAGWTLIWALIQDSAATWHEQFHQSEDRGGTWELGEPDSVAELQARVLFVLFQNVQENQHGHTQSSSSLKWHSYYYEEAGRYLLLYRFLIQLNQHTNGGRRMCIHRPSDAGWRKTGQLSWEKTQGFQIHQLSKAFVRGILKP